MNNCNCYLIKQLKIRIKFLEGQHEFISNHKNIWDENCIISRPDWKLAISNDDTQLGYWEYVQHRLDEIAVT